MKLLSWFLGIFFLLLSSQRYFCRCLVNPSFFWLGFAWNSLLSFYSQPVRVLAVKCVACWWSLLILVPGMFPFRGLTRKPFSLRLLKSLQLLSFSSLASPIKNKHVPDVGLTFLGFPSFQAFSPWNPLSPLMVFPHLQIYLIFFWSRFSSCFGRRIVLKPLIFFFQ